MPGLEDIDNLSLDQLEQFSRGETSGLLPDVSPVSAPAAKEEPKPEPKVEPAAKVEPAPAAKADDKTVAPAVDDDGEEVPADPNKATIPYQKYAREKKKIGELVKSLETRMAEERAASTKELTELREKFARGDERLRVLSEAFQPPADDAANQDPEPDPNTDVIAWVNWSRREHARQRDMAAQTQDALNQSQAEQALQNNYQSDVLAFTQTNKDWLAAYNHLLNTRGAMLQGMGYNIEQIKTIIRNEEKGLVERAFKNRQSPASYIYNMAKQMGYVTPAPPPDPVPAADAKPVANGNGHVNGNGAEHKSSAVEDVERIQRGMAGAKSLADVGGAPQEISVEALASMSEKEFAAYYAKHQARVDNLLGKR